MTELWDEVCWRSDEREWDDFANLISICPGCTLQDVHASHGTCVVRARSGGNIEGLHIGSKYVRSQNTKNKPQLDHRMASKATPWPIALGQRANDNGIIKPVWIGGGRGNRAKCLGRL